MPDREKQRVTSRLLPPLQDASAALPVHHHTVVPVETAPERRGIVAVLSGSAQHGNWAVARRIRVVAVFGGAQLDLREAQIPAGECEIEIFCMFGGVQIIVPPGIRVTSQGAAFAGGFETAGAYTAPPDAPLVHVRGSVYFGGVQIVVKEVGEEV